MTGTGLPSDYAARLQKRLHAEWRGGESYEKFAQRLGVGSGRTLKSWLALDFKIVTLWHIPDEPTAALMVAFYRYLDQGLDKAQALRQAMLTIAQEYPDPSHWAAFTLIGEAE